MSEAMKMLLCWFALLLQILCWVPATSRVLLAPDNDVSPKSSQSHASYTPTTTPIQIQMQGKTEQVLKEARYNRGVKQIGSKPPDCEHKCDGCFPCVAIQVPTITSHFQLQYANYEPESWKCKCGLFCYSP